MLIRNTNGAYVHSEGRQLVFDLPDRTKLNEQSPSPNEEEEYWHPQTPLNNGNRPASLPERMRRVLEKMWKSYAETSKHRQ